MSWLTNNWQIIASWTLFGTLYLATYRPAVRTLSAIVALSMVGTHSWKFWKKLALYRLILLAPYMSFLVFHQGIPVMMSRMLLIWVVFITALGVLQLAGKDHMINLLWWLYGWVYDGLLNFYPYQNLIRTVAERLDLQDHMDFLEVGCGTGNVMMEARKRAHIRVVGVDNSSSMLRQAGRKLRRAIKVGEAELYKQDALEFLKGLPDGSYDRISLVNFLYAVPDRQEVWTECMRILRPGGLIVASTSIASGQKSIIQESFANSTVLQAIRQLTTLRLWAVMIIDFMISSLAQAGAFEFPEQEVLIGEVDAVGGRAEHVERCYGGAEDGVNIVFSVTR